VPEITLSHLKKNEGYNGPALVEGIWGSSANRLAFREHRRRSYNIIKNSIYSQLLPSFIHKTGQYLPRHQYSPAKYALQRVVQSFRNSISELAEHHSTHIYAVVFRFCQLENIYYRVLRYLNTGTLPFEKYSEEWLVDSKVQFTSTSGTVVGTVLI
jgi:hypothetical protein